MIIDFHTHIFPEKIAASTVDYLAEICNTKPYTKATKESLLASMHRADITLSVALPVATKVSQMDSINRFAAGFQDGPILSFAGIHPDCEDYRKALLAIKQAGFKGIKLHPDYQNVYFNDIRYKRMIDFASELDLIIVVHAGVDPKCPQDIHCTPKMAREVIDEVAPKKLVLAHLGGNQMTGEVEEQLIGQPVYLDTAVVLNYLKEEEFIRLARNHGMDRILFATDSPWAGQTEFVEKIRKSALTEEEKEQIFSKNASRLLGLDKKLKKVSRSIDF